MRLEGAWNTVCRLNLRDSLLYLYYDHKMDYAQLVMATHKTNSENKEGKVVRV